LRARARSLGGEPEHGFDGGTAGILCTEPEGRTPELVMTAEGLVYLIGLTPVELNDVSRGPTTDVWKLDCKGVSGRFINLWRVRIYEVWRPLRLS